MRTPLAHVLHDFGRPPPGPPAQAEPCPAVPAATLPAPAEDRATKLVDEAFARGEQAGRGAAEAELEQALREAQLRAEEQLAAEHLKWRSEHADELASRLASGVDELESKISTAVTRVLTPFLTTQLRANMVDALGESIRTLLSGGRHAALHIGGPEDLLAVLREKLGAVPVGIEWEPNQEMEVRVAADHTMIETDLQRWIDRFAEACR